MTLEERLEQDAPAWRPDQEDPDILIGEVISVDVGESEYGKYPLLVVRMDDGTEKALHGFQTVLRNELIRQRPQVGERLGVKYLGEQPTKPGSRFKSYTGYRVKVEREHGRAFDWSQLGAHPEPTDQRPGEDPYAQAAAEEPPVEVPADAQADGIPF